MRVTRTKTKKVLLIATVLITVFTAAVAPTRAQGQAQPPEPVEVTGVLGAPYSRVPDPEPIYALTDEGTGTPYELTSDSVDLGPYVGQRITAYGSPVSGDLPPGAPLLLNVSRVESSSGAVKETFMAAFELTVEGEPPPGTVFFGVAAITGFGPDSASVQLTDPDGDGTYTGSVEVPRGAQRGVFVEQGSGVEENPLGFRYPGEPSSVVEDYGIVTFDGDKVFSTSASFGGAVSPPAR